MNLNDLPPGYGDPLEALLGFHRRIERQLANLCTLPAYIDANGLDAQSSASAASIIEFFSGAMELHHADEDELLALLDVRLGSDASALEIHRDLCVRLGAEHREMERAWRGLRRPLQSIGEGVHRTLSLEQAQYFRTLHSMHISLEEGAMHRSATRMLEPSDRASLSRGMVARRVRKHRFQ
jgi:hemerythrin-like domain-containing protein